MSIESAVKNTGRSLTRNPAISYVFVTAGAHLVATQSVRRSTEGTEPNDALKSCAPLPDDIISHTQLNSPVFIESTEGGESYPP